MPPAIPAIPGTKVVRALERAGLRNILAIVGMDVDELRKLL
jgi:hypothetical protein